MIKIIEKEVKIVKEYDVEPKVVTLYYADKYNKDVKKVENCVFQKAIPISANDYRLEYENNELYIYIRVDIKTGIVKGYNEYFFDEAKAVKIHRELRMEYLKNIIDGLKDAVTRLKKYQQELEELKNFEKKGERK